MPSWKRVALMGLSTWRLTHLVTEDEFPPVRWARNRIVARGPEWLGDLVTCYWCASVWLAAGVVTTDAVSQRRRRRSTAPGLLLTFGAVAALSPILSVVVERLEWRPEQEDEGEDEDEMATLQMQVGVNGRVDA